MGRFCPLKACTSHLARTVAVEEGFFSKEASNKDKGSESSEMDGVLRGEWVGVMPLLLGSVWRWICSRRWSPLC
jgi:hypothetical protein